MGICIGIVSTQTLSGLTEFLPVEHRELAVAIVISCYSVGVIYFLCIFKLVDPDFQVGKWRTILIYSSFPCIIACVYILFAFRDSPRLHFNKERFEEGMNGLKELNKGTNVVITQENEDNIKKELAINKTKKIDFSFQLLFSEKYARLTLVNLFLMTSTSIVYVSNFFSLPLILYKERKHHTHIFIEIIIAQSIAIPAIILAALISGIPNFGRKNTIMIGLFFSLWVSIYPWALQSGIVVCCALINFFNMIAYFLSKLYLIESFPSKLRDHGMSLIFLIARFGESLSPFICEELFKHYEFGPMMFISGLLLIGLIASFFIPFETRGEAIDSKID